MYKTIRSTDIIRRTAALLLCLVMAAVCTPFISYAEGSGKTVKAGWYESPFNRTDRSGRRSGYAYEYQLDLASYTGWNYEYVDGSWPELLQKLEDGEIDLLSDVSYTEERAEKMLFSSLPMGTEEYDIFIARGDESITPDDLTTLNGKRIGVNKGSVQAAFYREWARKNGINAELLEFTISEDEAVDMLEGGKLDAYITLNAYGDPSRLVPVCKIGSSDFYFAVSKDRPDLLKDLNDAMSRIQDGNRYYNQRMFEKYMVMAGSNAFLTTYENKWLAAHGAVRVGYLAHSLAFCARDEETGELTGALKEILERASDSLANAHIDFEPVSFDSSEEAMKALSAGEIDCLFPSNLSSYDGEKMGLSITPSLIDAEIYAIVSGHEKEIFAKREHVVVAINEGNIDYESLLDAEFPDWKRVYYSSLEDCLKAVSDRVADCVLISNYRYNNIARICDKYNLATYTTGVDIDYGFAVRNGETELYSVLAKASGMIPLYEINAALSKYIASDAAITLQDIVDQHLGTIVLIILAILLLIFLMWLRAYMAVRRSKQLIEATETDGLTGLFNRDYFFRYANRMFRDNPGTAMDAIVINIEQFHTVNALNGREFGDRILTVLGNEIAAIAEEYEGIGGRFGADRFDILCKHTHDYQAIFDRLQGKLTAIAPTASVQLRMGVMPWNKDLEPVQLFDRARTACSMARGNFSEHLIVFDNKVRDREILEQKLLNDLKRAIDEYQFEVYYQPKYDIQTDPPKLVSAEALLRWQHPELGMIPPDEFIPLFERNGRITEIDKYVWNAAARQVVKWREQFGIDIPISVNLSRVDVFDPNLEETLDNILAVNGISCSDLKLEVTETAYTENAGQLIRVVERLRHKGYQVEMDDFGTGYSSLNMLSAMPVDVIKMDRTFIQNLENNEKDIQLVALILGIADNLKIPVVAEGVETESQMKLLKELGCSVVQGYYFSRPLHPDDFETEIIDKLRSDSK